MKHKQVIKISKYYTFTHQIIGLILDKNSIKNPQILLEGNIKEIISFKIREAIYW